MLKTKPIKFVKKVLIFACIGAVLAGVFFVGGMRFGATGSYEKITSSLISQKISGIGELATVSYMYTNMGKYENQTDFYGWKVPLTKKSFIISYDGEIKAGIEVSAIQIDVEGKKIMISLPQAKVLSHEINQESIEVFDETKNIFNQINITDYTQFCIDQKQKTEAKAIEKGLMTEARAKGREVIRGLLTQHPIIENNYEITFKE